jgi:pyruvoyl-dependent arginine decarboxylase
MECTILGNRIPYEYFVTTGKGESDAGSDGLPYETGSYDAALNDAGIQNANIIEYTSVIPTEAKEISITEGLSRIRWGEVLETIKAQSNGSRNSNISAAVMITTIHDPNGKFYGGFACEYSGGGSKKEAEDSLLFSISDMIQRRGYGKIIGTPKLYKDLKTDKKFTIHAGKKFVYENLHVTKSHGTVFALICFVSHKYPILKDVMKEPILETIKNPIRKHMKTRKNRKK